MWAKKCPNCKNLVGSRLQFPCGFARLASYREWTRTRLPLETVLRQGPEIYTHICQYHIHIWLWVKKPVPRSRLQEKRDCVNMSLLIDIRGFHQLMSEGLAADWQGAVAKGWLACHAFPLDSRNQRQSTPMLVSLETVHFYATLMCLFVLETKVTVIQESSTSFLQARCSVFRTVIVLLNYDGQWSNAAVT